MSLKKISCIVLFFLCVAFFEVGVFGAPWITLNLNYDGANHKYNAESVYLFINGEEIKNLTMPPIILNQTTLVPAREVFEPLGAKVEWRKETSEVFVTYNNNTVSIIIGSKTAKVNGENIQMQIPPKIINNKTMIPVRFIAEALNFDVQWDKASRYILIREKQNVDETQSIVEKTTEETSNADIIYGYEEEGAILKNVKCEDGFLKVEAKGKFGDYSVPNSSNKKIIAFDIHNIELGIQNDYNFDDEYVKSVNLLQIQEKPAKIIRVAVELRKETDYNVYVGNNGTSLEVDFKKRNLDIGSNNFYWSDGKTETTTASTGNIDIPMASGTIVPNDNFTFDSNFKRLKIRKGSVDFNASNVKINNDYVNNKCVFNLNCNLSSVVNSGNFYANDSLIKNINVSSLNDNTHIIFETNDLIEFSLFEDKNDFYIYWSLPREVYSKIVVIDAGHGGHDGGAYGNGLLEKNINIDIALKLKALFERDNSVKVYMTRSDDTFVELEQRAAFANKVGDIFISIHQNSFDAERANGTEVWYYPHSNDNTIGFTSKRLAELAQDELIKLLGSTNRGVKSTDYVVLTKTKIPAILCEIGFITNVQEASKLSGDSYRQAAAQALYNSALKAFEEYSPVRK